MKELLVLNEGRLGVITLKVLDSLWSTCVRGPVTSFRIPHTLNHIEVG